MFPLPTVLVLFAALAMRLLVVRIVITKYPPAWLFTHGVEMGLLARSILSGHGLSSPFGGSTGPSAFIAPVYPLLVAAVFKLFGQYSQASSVVIMTAQIALNLITLWLIMHIARRVFSPAAATLSGLIWAISPPLVWMPSILWETSLSCCLLTGLLAICVRHFEREFFSPLQWAGIGAYCGLAALVNPALLPSLLAIAVWLAFQLRRHAGRQHPWVAALAFALVFSPWPIRNARVFHAFIPLRTTVGFELWMGNRPGATGFLDETVFPMYNARELADYNARGEVAYSARKSQLARAYIASHPAWFLRMTAARAIRFWLGTGTRNGSTLFAIHACCTTLAGFAGLWLLVRSRRYALTLLFALPLALFPLPYLITHAEFRYRLVVDPMMTLFAAFALTELCRVAAHSHRPARKLIERPSF